MNTQHKQLNKLRKSDSTRTRQEQFHFQRKVVCLWRFDRTLFLLNFWYLCVCVSVYLIYQIRSKRLYLVNQYSYIYQIRSKRLYLVNQYSYIYQIRSKRLYLVNCYSYIYQIRSKRLYLVNQYSYIYQIRSKRLFLVNQYSYMSFVLWLMITLLYTLYIHTLVYTNCFQFDCERSSSTYVNHIRIRSWNKPIRSNMTKVSCSWKQVEPLIGSRLTPRSYINCIRVRCVNISAMQTQLL